MKSAFWLLLETLGSLLATACLLRAFAWWQKLSSRNPIMPFVFAVTDWIVKPLRRIVPASRRVDWASLVAALLLAIALASVYSLLMRARSPLQLGVLFFAIFWLCKWAVYLLIGVVLLQAVLSWVNPQAPMAPALEQLSRPFLAPIRRFIPLLGGVDLSPLLLILLAQVLLSLLEALLAFALHLVP